MSIDLSQLREWLLIAGGCLIWFVRLEGRVNQGDRDQVNSDKRLDLLTNKHYEQVSLVQQQLADVRESLARIEGALGVNKQD